MSVPPNYGTAKRWKMGFGQNITPNSIVSCWFRRIAFVFSAFSPALPPCCTTVTNHESCTLYSYTIHHNHFLSCKEKDNFFNPTWADGFPPLPHRSFLRGWKIAFGSALVVDAYKRLQGTERFPEEEETPLVLLRSAVSWDLAWTTGKEFSLKASCLCNAFPQ